MSYIVLGLIAVGLFWIALCLVSCAVLTVVARRQARGAWQPQPQPGFQPPAPSRRADESDLVLVHYAAVPGQALEERWSVARFCHRPPHGAAPGWVDQCCSRGRPDAWWPLPEAPNVAGEPQTPRDNH